MKKLAFGLFSLLLFYSVSASVDMELESAIILGERGVIVLQENEEDYRLDDTITRKEFMKVFVKLIGSQVEDRCDFSFGDVKNDWGCKYIEWALRNSHIAANTYFRPNDQITKAESMKLVLKARGIARIEDSGDWRQDDMRTAYRKGIISEEYSDYDTYADRGWIFLIAATPTSGSGGGTGGGSSSSSSSSSTGGGGIEIDDSDWRNKVP